MRIAFTPMNEHAAASNWHSAAWRTSILRADCQLADNRTVLTNRYHDAPLKIAKTFRENATGALALYLMDASPGLMDRDHYHIGIHLGEQSHLLVTTQSFTKVHPARQHGCELAYRFDIGAGAILEYFPEPTIPYLSSKLTARTVFHLAPGAALLYADILTPGRSHRNEQFQWHSLSMRTEVYRSHELKAWDHLYLQPDQHNYRAVGAWEHYTHTGTFWIVSDQANERLLADIRAAIAEASPSTILAAASLLCEHGIAVRMLGTAAWELQALCDVIWSICRRSLWGYAPYYMRK